MLLPLATKIYKTSKIQSILQYLISETNSLFLFDYKFCLLRQKKRTIDDYARTIELFSRFDVILTFRWVRHAGEERSVDEIFAKVEDVITESNIRSFQTIVRWQKVKFAWEDRTVTGSLRAPTYSHVLFFPLFRYFFAYAFCTHGEREHAYELLLLLLLLLLRLLFPGRGSASQMYTSRKLRVQIDFPYI